jgi:hypothetical protein
MALAAALLLAETTACKAHSVTADESSRGGGPVDSVDGVHWRFEALVGRGYEKNLPPTPPTPLSGPPPPTPPPVTSPGDDRFNTAQLAASWHYRTPVASADTLQIDWPTRLQAVLTRYDTFSQANRDEFILDSLPGFIYGDNETRLSARLMNMRVNDSDFIQEYLLRLLQIKTVRPPFGFGVGVDVWEQTFAPEPIALQQDRRRSRLVAGVVGRFPHRSRLALLASAGRDAGLQQRDDYDVWGLELDVDAAVSDKLKVRLLAEHEEGDSVQVASNRLQRRKLDLRARYRVAPAWVLDVGYKLEELEVGDFSLPANERYEVTLGLAW